MKLSGHWFACKETYKFQYVEQMKTAAGQMVSGCTYVVMFGQNVVILESSMGAAIIGMEYQQSLFQQMQETFAVLRCADTKEITHGCAHIGKGSAQPVLPLRKKCDVRKRPAA